MHYQIFTRIILFAFVLSAPVLGAQNASPHREVGLQFSGINFNGNNNISAFYKKQKSEQVYRRLRFFYGNLNAQTSEDQYYFSMSAGIAIGREKRKTLDSKLEFYQGPEFGASLGVSALIDSNTDISLGGRFGWVLGLQHSFNERWAINLETIPSVGVNVITATARDVTRLDLNATASNSVSIGMVRKF